MKRQKCMVFRIISLIVLNSFVFVNMAFSLEIEMYMQRGSENVFNLAPRLQLNSGLFNGLKLDYYRAGFPKELTVDFRDFLFGRFSGGFIRFVETYYSTGNIDNIKITNSDKKELIKTMSSNWRFSGEIKKMVLSMFKAKKSELALKKGKYYDLLQKMSFLIFSDLVYEFCLKKEKNSKKMELFVDLLSIDRSVLAVTKYNKNLGWKLRLAWRKKVSVDDAYSKVQNDILFRYWERYLKQRGISDKNIRLLRDNQIDREDISTSFNIHSIIELFENDQKLLSKELYYSDIFYTDGHWYWGKFRNERLVHYLNYIRLNYAERTPNNIRNIVDHKFIRDMIQQRESNILNFDYSLMLGKLLEKGIGEKALCNIVSILKLKKLAGTSPLKFLYSLVDIFSIMEDRNYTDMKDRVVEILETREPAQSSPEVMLEDLLALLSAFKYTPGLMNLLDENASFNHEEKESTFYSILMRSLELMRSVKDMETISAVMNQFKVYFSKPQVIRKYKSLTALLAFEMIYQSHIKNEDIFKLHSSIKEGKKEDLFNTNMVSDYFVEQQIKEVITLLQHGFSMEDIIEHKKSIHQFNMPDYYGNWEVLWNRASDISHYFDIDLTQAFKFSYELFLLDKFKQDFNNSYGVLFEDMKKLKSLEIQKIIAEFSWICKVINARNSKEFLVNINRLDKNLQKIQNQDKRNFVKKNIFKKPPENSRRMLRYYLDDTMLSWEYFMIMNAEPGDASYYLDISIDTVNIIRKAAKEGARNGKSASDIDETIRYFLQLHRKQANPEVKKPVGNLETEAINSSI